MNRKNPQDILRRAQARTRQALNAKKVLDREFRKLPRAQRRQIVKLKHQGFTSEDLADHDFNYTIGTDSDLPVGESSAWDTLSDRPSTEWESIDLESRAPSSYYSAGQRPRWNLSRIASGTDEAFAVESAEEAGLATSEFGPEVAIPISAAVFLAYKYPNVARAAEALLSPIQYGVQEFVKAGFARSRRDQDQVHPAPATAGGPPQVNVGWGNTLNYRGA
jgi:hypothetical protein